ncbi:DUF4279 domain-containing protein [Microvirga sp. 0TCS3.31]
MPNAQGYATLRITKPGMTASAITDRIGLAPTHAHEAGDTRPGVESRYREAMWSLSTQGRGEGLLPDHLSALLEIVEPQHEALRQLADEGFEMDWSATSGCPAMAVWP